MKVELNYNRTTGAVTQSGTEWTPPFIVFGESLELAWRFTEQNAGLETPLYPNVTHLRSDAGEVDARPEQGTWCLQIGAGPATAANTTEPVSYDATAEELQAAIAAKGDVVTAYGAPAVTKTDGSWLIVFGTGSVEVPLQVRRNRCFPVALLRVGAAQVDGAWEHELRLVQGPLAFADTYATVLPPQPVVSVVQNGSTEGDLTTNTIQSLTLPQAFRGTFQLTTATGKKTAGLSVNDTMDVLATAIGNLYGAENVSVTLAADYLLHVEFIADLEGVAVEAMTASPLDTPPGAPTMTLLFDRHELNARLRRAAVVTVPFEVVATVEEEEVERTWVLLRKTITILRPLIFPELALVPAVDFLRPPSPIDYRLFDPSTVITGQQYYPEVVGDGEATQFVLDHGLDTTVVRVWVTENLANGLQLVEGTDYRVRIIDANSVRVTSLVGAPAADGWLVVVMSAQTVAAFAAGLTIEIDQVNGLEAELDALKARLTTVESYVPTRPLVLTDLSAVAMEIAVPERYIIFPDARVPAEVNLKALVTGDSGEIAKLPRGGGFLPAIADSSLTEFDDGVLPTPSAGQGYKNTGSSAVLLPGGLGRKSSYLPPGAVAGYDGRVWFNVTRGAAGVPWYFPTDYEKLLVPEITLDEDLWQATQRLRLVFNLSLALFKTNAAQVQWTLVIEHGVDTSATSPSPAVPNLDTVTWHATPLLTQRLLVTELIQTRRFGCEIVRASNDEISATKLIQNRWSIADSAPASPQFLLRARLIRFDTRNADTDGRGFAFAAITKAEAAIK